MAGERMAQDSDPTVKSKAKPGQGATTERESVAEQQLEAELLWQELAVGDEVLVEFPIYERSLCAGMPERPSSDASTVELLTPGRGYLILEKCLSATQVPQFMTESNTPGRRALVYPHCICSYRRADESTIN